MILNFTGPKAFDLGITYQQTKDYENESACIVDDDIARYDPVLKWEGLCQDAEGTGISVDPFVPGPGTGAEQKKE